MVDINLPKALTESLPSPPPPPVPRFESSSHSKSNMPMLYYGLVVVATAAIVLAIYNLIIVRWCANQYRRSREANNQHFASHRRPSTSRNNNITPSTLSRGSSTIGLTSSFRYKKGIIEDASNDKDHLDNDIECSVCLSVFEEGEEVRKLARCNHSFHASCIDMWLYSHFDCPLCRAPVVDTSETPPQHRHTDSEHSRDELLASSSV